MHTRSLLEAWLRRNCSFIHRARLTAVVKLVDSLLVGGKATVAELGRNMRTLAYEKHAIKCADRLIGNRHLTAERMSVYRTMAQWVLGATARPWTITRGPGSLSIGLTWSSAMTTSCSKRRCRSAGERSPFTKKCIR